MPAEIKAISCLLCLNANDPADMVDVDLVHHAIPAAHRAKVCRRCAEVIALAAVNSDPPIIPQSVWESSIKQMLENPEFMEAVKHGAEEPDSGRLGGGGVRDDHPPAAAGGEEADALVLENRPGSEGAGEHSGESEVPGASGGVEDHPRATVDRGNS